MTVSPLGPGRLELASVRSGESQFDAELVAESKRQWPFRGRGSKLPQHKAQASLRTPNSGLEQDLQAELDHPRPRPLVSHLAEGSARRCRVGREKLRVVESVD